MKRLCRSQVSLAKCLPFVLMTCLVFTVSCTGPVGSGPIKTPLSPTVTLELSENSDGDLELCSEEGDCDSYPNPNDCVFLEIEINTITGESCERCYNDQRELTHESCSETSVACTVVTLPEPDCVVCAYVNGAVIFSSCIPEEPPVCVTRVSPSGEECEQCYDADGHLVIDECGHDCGDVICPQVLCAPGYHAAFVPGECCEQCVPNTDCDEVICPADVPVPDCPDGYTLQRDPNDCCLYYCEPGDCNGTTDAATDSANDGVAPCPPGYHWSAEYPDCGRCVEDEPTEGEPCVSTSECADNEICTTELGVCNRPPGCEPNDICPEVCYGTCRTDDDPCDDPTPLYPQPAECEGEWRQQGHDENGCVLPPVCVCADGVISLNGRCEDSCENVACFAPPPECGAGTHLEMGYPYCCGICVPDEECWELSDSATDAQSPHDCPQILCAEGYHIEVGPRCCDICVPDQTTCTTSHDCAETEACSTEHGDCRLPPDWDATNHEAGCVEECTGVCEPLPRCREDADCHDGTFCDPLENCDDAMTISSDGAGCGGVCRPIDYCASSEDCRDDQYCTTRDGDCYPHPGCTDDMPCPAVCYGKCKDIPAPVCEGPNPAITCLETGCDDDSECRILPLTVCRPSSCFCDENGQWACTDDCEPPMGCVPVGPTCIGPNPAITCETTGCDDGFECKELPIDVCVPSHCECNDETGDWRCTEDCGRPMGCVPEVNECVGPNPSITCEDTGCHEGYECRISGAEGCVPSACGCDTQNGLWFCTADCQPVRECLPIATNCDEPDPSMTCEDTGCHGNLVCRPTGEDSCVPSACFCDGDTGAWMCTRDCNQPLGCLPPEEHGCHSNSDCEDWEECVRPDEPCFSTSADSAGNCPGQCIPLPD